MCVAGLYFVFLLLEDVIIGYYSTDAASQDQEMKVAYNILQKNLSVPIYRDNFLKLKNSNQKINFIFNVSTTPYIPHKKHQIARVTRKQYEIVNLLWRKTKIFVDDDYIYQSTPSNKVNITKRILKRFQENTPIVTSIPVIPSLLTTTPSNIEFYYLEDTQDNFKRDNEGYLKIKQKNERALNSNDVGTTTTTSSSFLVFHLKGPYAKPLSNKWSTLIYSGIRLNKPQPSIQNSNSNKITTKKIVENKNHEATIKSFQEKKYLLSTPLPNKVKSTFKHKSIGIIVNISKLNQIDPESTTVYDKIKFFEMYDQNTVKNTRKKDTILKQKSSDNELNNRKILLEHVNQGSHDHDQAKHSKKHVTEGVQNLHVIVKKNNDNIDPNLLVLTKTQVTKMLHGTKVEGNRTKFPSSKKENISYNYMSQTVSWKDYPFVAVYIHEPSQVHCDAAGINAHWLVASGSCLSRVSKNPETEGQSAFVTYCGEQWWRPERVSYVKYSFVHPWYHPRDKTRRHLYNIGVIQVVNSMRRACNSWAPVSLMSHQYVASSEGAEACALGWGLDRFDTRYSSADLPKLPLMIYKSNVYIDSCPGNVGYSKAKRLNEGGGIKNVHCLTLPPYSGEENDPVHGGLLLVEGKLIATYLQEERRPWGDQSAQYTGIWRLIPWVMDKARETDDIDTVIFDI